MQARYYDPVIGRFYSNDPVGFTGDITSFNRYSYVGNNPYKYTDPDGQNRLLVMGARFAKNPTRAPKIISRAIRSAAEGAGILSPVRNENAGDVGSGVNPDVPDGIVGDQSDPRAGPNKSGNKHTSGPLSPENGGTGSYEEDLGTLTGGTSPAGAGDSAPPGAQVGENGIFGRSENKSGGASIDIPAKGDKPHETLHYDKEKT
tara:strand:- start:1846 stop:2454 length:609 start_codon:yes stop_codon:yes gene_type:complete